jgi:hypothetical protein
VADNNIPEYSEEEVAKWQMACGCGATTGDTHTSDCTWKGKVYPTHSGKNRQYEMMTRFYFGPEELTVRVWSTSPKFQMGPDLAVRDCLSVLARRLGNVEPLDIVIALETCVANLAAYEIVDRHGRGAVVYPDWK